MNILTPNWPAPSHIQAFTTTRHSLSPDVTRPDQDTNLEMRFSLPSSPVWLNQTHSATAIEALPEHLKLTADASYTNQLNRVCVVLTADCLPILLCNASATKVAAIHAGWRGLAAGIIENTIAQIGDPHEQWMAWLGPAIGPHCFEVGNDVWQAFVSHHPIAATAFKPKSHDKWLANLYHLAKQRLQALGITNIYGGEYCTYTQQDLFYSYRRDQGKTGRMATMIWIQS